ncbi:MAG: hypothetical protein KJ065_14100 [Anaerolineae bacterium]|nr:hypothetical protein [Anaerolineae bacterium]
MSVEYMIIPSEIQTFEFVLKSEYVMAELQKRWPGIEAKLYSEGKSSGVSWTVWIEDYLAVGDFSEERRSLVVSAPITYAAMIAIWYRKLIPLRYKLVIVDTLVNFTPFEIQDDTTREEIVNALS